MNTYIEKTQTIAEIDALQIELEQLREEMASLQVQAECRDVPTEQRVESTRRQAAERSQSHARGTDPDGNVDPLENLRQLLARSTEDKQA